MDKKSSGPEVLFQQVIDRAPCLHLPARRTRQLLLTFRASLLIASPIGDLRWYPVTTPEHRPLPQTNQEPGRHSSTQHPPVQAFQLIGLDSCGFSRTLNRTPILPEPPRLGTRQQWFLKQNPSPAQVPRVGTRQQWFLKTPPTASSA